MTTLGEQDKWIRYPDTGHRERDRGRRYDPVEDEPEFQAVIEDVRIEARRRLELHSWRNRRGFGHVLCKTIKLILREDHGIRWRTHVEMNPHIFFD